MRSRETTGFRRGTDARLTRKEMEFDAEKTRQLAAHYKAIIELLGEDAGREGLLKTPDRVAKAMQFLTQGYAQDPEEILRSAITRKSPA